MPPPWGGCLQSSECQMPWLTSPSKSSPASVYQECLVLLKTWVEYANGPSSRWCQQDRSIKSWRDEWRVDCQQVLELLWINAGDCRVALDITAGLVGAKVQLINRVNFHWLATSMQAWMITGLILLASKLIVHCSKSLAMQWGAGICFEW